MPHRHVPLAVVVDRIEVGAVVRLVLSPHARQRVRRRAACAALPPHGVAAVRERVDEHVLQPRGQRRTQEGRVQRGHLGEHAARERRRERRRADVAPRRRRARREERRIVVAIRRPRRLGRRLIVEVVAVRQPPAQREGERAIAPRRQPRAYHCAAVHPLQRAGLRRWRAVPHGREQRGRVVRRVRGEARGVAVGGGAQAHVAVHRPAPWTAQRQALPPAALDAPRTAEAAGGAAPVHVERCIHLQRAALRCRVPHPRAARALLHARPPARDGGARRARCRLLLHAERRALAELVGLDEQRQLQGERNVDRIAAGVGDGEGEGDGGPRRRGHVVRGEGREAKERHAHRAICAQRRLDDVEARDGKGAAVANRADAGARRQRR